MKIPYIYNYKLKEEHFSSVQELLVDLPLIMYVTDKHGIGVFSKTSTPYMDFKYHVSENNPLDDYLCYTMTHALQTPELLGLEINEYFPEKFLEHFVDNLQKCIPMVHYATEENFKKHKDKFNEEIIGYDWSKIVTELKKENMVRVTYTNHSFRTDDRDIIEIDGKEIENLSVDLLKNETDRNFDYERNMLLDLFIRL